MIYSLVALNIYKLEVQMRKIISFLTLLLIAPLLPLDPSRRCKRFLEVDLGPLLANEIKCFTDIDDLHAGRPIGSSRSMRFVDLDRRTSLR